MRIPESLVPLVDHGVVDEVVRSLKSGKEADVYLVASEGFYRVAKVYKDAQSRSFKNRAAYTEGRQVRSSRDQRAMDKGSRYGRAQNEAAWQSAEVDMIYRLDAAGVRVPKPHHFIDGVLIMELVASADGQPAPRLGEVEFTAEEAQAVFRSLLADTVKMLAAGVVHGDLSEFNVLVSAAGPVVIDFPQAVNAARNQNARKMLLRDVENLQLFLKRWVPGTPSLRYAEEMWQLYEKGELTAETQLTGKFVDERKQANTGALLGLIDDARRDERFKRQQSGRSFRGLGGPPREGNGAPPPQRPHGQPQQRAPHAPGQPRPPHPQGARPHGPHQPRPPHGQSGQQRAQHGQSHPRPPEAQRPPHPQQGQPPARPPQAHSQRPPHAPGQHRPPAPGQHRPPHAHPQQRPAHAQNQQRPAHAQNQQRPAHAESQQRPPHAQGQQRPPQGNSQRPRPHQQRGRPGPIVETRPVLAGGSPRPGEPAPLPRPPQQPERK